MAEKILIVADDFGLTRSITDTILETVDAGTVTRVSIIPNGEAVEYALSEYKKRSDNLTLALHINLSEGNALSAPEDITHLVNARGMFVHSVVGLWFAYIFASNAKRRALCNEIRSEITAQCKNIRMTLGTGVHIINSHQHVHLIPFVFDELIKIPDIKEIRTVREPFQWSWSFSSMLTHLVLHFLSKRAAHIMRLKGVATNDSFIGFVHSGYMTEKALHTGLARANSRVEVLLHPGSAAEGELSSWKGSRSDIKWHYSPWRAKERKMLVTFRSK